MSNAVAEYPPYSVLMLVYDKVDPEEFSVALGSMTGQSLPPDEIVLVCDGPLTEGLERVISSFQKDFPDLMRIVPMPEHIGVGRCTNIGLDKCANDIVVRMDSDDISEKDRCQKELAQFAADRSLDIVSGFIMEFEDDVEKGYLRVVPTEPSETLRYARRRMPFSNVTIAYRKSKVQECGGYRELTRAEDYDMICRMLMAGARFKTLPELLVRVRVSPDAYRRRKSWEHAKSLIGVRWGLYRMGFTSLWDFAVMSSGHIATMLMPERLVKRLYEKKLRTSYNNSDSESN